MTRSPLAPTAFPPIPAIAGVKLAATASGVKKKNRPDLMLALLAPGSHVAGVLTSSKTASAPVEWCRAALLNGRADALLVNAGNANAFTGKVGRDHACAMATAVSNHLPCATADVFVASTGVIGETLPCDRITAAVPKLIEQVSDTAWHQAAAAICTTDTFSKGAYRQIELDGKTINIAGIAKGSGMIAPDMATMLAFVFTDAALEADLLQTLLTQHVATTFNCITIDSDTSTSDTLLLFATGQSRVAVDDSDASTLATFSAALEQVLQDLALQIVRDGEGASKLITIDVTNAESTQAARRIGLAIANSPLVKTAIAGEDANWGRVVMAVGKAGEAADRDRLQISMGGVLIAAQGQRVAAYDEQAVNQHLKGQEISIAVDLGIGDGNARVWTCDLTHGYITINADYRS